MERLPSDIQYAIWKQVYTSQVIGGIRNEAKKQEKKRGMTRALAYKKRLEERREKRRREEATELYERATKRVREGEGIRRRRRMSAIGGGDGYISYERLRELMEIY
jgi:hypothetical protein